jgi:hypothetical protein
VADSTETAASQDGTLPPARKYSRAEPVLRGVKTHPPHQQQDVEADHQPVCHGKGQRHEEVSAMGSHGRG